MRFSFAILSLAAAVYGQSTTAPNAFNIPSTGNYLLSAGQSQVFTWSNPTPGTVTIYLTEGANSNLKRIATLASNIANSGTYTYNVPSDISEGADYALEIVNDADTSQINYTPQFVIQSPIKAIQTSGGSTSLLTIGASASNTASTASVSASTTLASSAVATGSSNSTASRSGSSTATGSSASQATAASGSRTSGAAGASATAPSTAGAAQGATAASGLLALAFGVAMLL